MSDGAGERGVGRQRVVSDGGTAALRRVLAGYAFASVAVGTTGVAVAVVLFDRSGSTAWATVGAVARVAPFVVLGALAGLVAGRLPARRTLLVAAVAQVVAATALLVTASPAPLALVACVSVVAHVAWTVAYPSIVSLVPRLVPATSIVTANGWLATLEALAWIVGPGVGGVVIAAAGVEAAAAMAIGCGVIAVVCLAPGAITRSAAGDESVEHVGLDRSDRSGASGRPGTVAASTGSGVKGTLAVLRDGARLVTGNPSTLGAVTLHLLADLIAGAVAVLLIVVAAERLGFGDGGYGVLSAAAAAGSFGALVLVRSVAGVTRPWSLLAVAVLTSGAPIAVLALIDAPAPALVLVAISGLGGVMAEVMALTTVQRTVPERSIAQVIGLLDTVSIGAFVVGTLAAGPLVELVGLDVALVAVGAIVPAVGVLVAPWLLRGVERGDRLVLLPGAQLIAGVSVLSVMSVRPDPVVAAVDAVEVPEVGNGQGAVDVAAAPVSEREPADEPRSEQSPTQALESAATGAGIGAGAVRDDQGLPAGGIGAAAGASAVGAGAVGLPAAEAQTPSRAPARDADPAPVDDITALPPVVPAVLVDPVDPVDSADPIAPVEPVDPVEPLDPIAPVEPVGPVEPLDPIAPVEPVGPVEPLDPIAPVEPVGPVEPLDPIAPVEPVDPVEPVVLVDPVDPVALVDPVVLVDPVDPVVLVDPVAPVDSLASDPFASDPFASDPFASDPPGHEGDDTTVVDDC